MNIRNNRNFIILLAIFIAVSLVIIYQTTGFLGPKSTKDKEIAKIETQSTSDAVEAIENDLNDTDLENLDRELQYIENELNQTI